MKTLVFILIIFLSSQSSFSQKIIEYNFLNDKVTGATTIDDGEQISFKITEINTFLYSATITVENNYYINAAVPEAFKKYLLTVDTDVPTISKSSPSSDFTEFYRLYSKFKTTTKIYNDILFNLHTDRLSFKIIEENTTIIIARGGFSRETIVDDCEIIVEQIKDVYLNFPANPSTERTMVEKLYKELEDKKFEEFPDQLQMLLSKVNVENFTVRSSQQKAGKDELVYKISIKPISDEIAKKYGVRRVEDFKIELEVLGGFRFDFSTGVYVTGLVNENFITFKENDSSRILRNGDSKINMGLSALAHGYCRTGKDVNIGFNVGVGVTSDENVQYLAGLSLLIGKKQRIILNGGGTIGKVNRLSSLVTEGQKYKEIPVVDYNIKEYKISWYGGVTYNF
ncbi:MAG: hypothetical protein SGI89_13535 [bacterium]|nr:hypothetical protein [bacterium]